MKKQQDDFHPDTQNHKRTVIYHFSQLPGWKQHLPVFLFASSQRSNKTRNCFFYY